jgi:hypothetical protein
VDPAVELLFAVVRQPRRLLSISPDQWNPLLRTARRTALSPRLAALVARAGIAGHLPARAREQLQAAEMLAVHHHRLLCWEMSRIRRALAGTGTPLVLLKGAAYVMADLPVAQGRLANDVDILVPREALDCVERALGEHGWEPLAADKYDDYYYRTWMHELPPLRHRERGTVIDVHHTILPPTGRVRPDPALLFQAARPIGDGGYRVLGPADMLLHSAAHLFQDGDLSGGLRDLIDLDIMLRHFGRNEPDFWQQLVPRARQLQLTGPLHYALRYAGRLLQTPIPEAVVAEAARGGPWWGAARAMDWLALRALVPEACDGDSWAGSAARLALYIRSHWLRMPPWLLARHLTRKAMRSRSPHQDK